MHGWVSLANEIKEEEEPWESYGDPNLFIPQPKRPEYNFKFKRLRPDCV